LIFGTKIMKTDGYLEKLYEVSLEIGLSAEPYKCFDLVLEKISSIGLRNGRIKLIGSEHDGVGNDGEARGGRLRNWMIDRVALNGSPLIVALDEGERPLPGNGAHLICVPVRCGHDTMAVLAAEHENPDEDALERDLQLLNVLSSLLVIPVQEIKSGLGSGGHPSSGNGAKKSLTGRVENFERELIIDALRKTRGNQTKAAALLGVSLRIINYRIGKLNLDYRRFRKVN
jgi:hypothetical protein